MTARAVLRVTTVRAALLGARAAHSDLHPNLSLNPTPVIDSTHNEEPA